MSEINKLQVGVTLFVLIGLLLGVGMVVLGGLGTATETKTLTNASVTLSNSTAVVIGVKDIVAGSPVVLVNYSGVFNRTLTTTNYTISNTAGTITLLATSDGFDGNQSLISLSYRGVIDSRASTAVNNTISAGASLASTWLPLLVIVLATSIILGLVLKSFRQK